jgi:hypothetical protein
LPDTDPDAAEEAAEADASVLEELEPHPVMATEAKSAALALATFNEVFIVYVSFLWCDDAQ